MLTAPSQLSKRVLVKKKKIFMIAENLYSTIPWKFCYGNTFKQNTDYSKFPQFDVFKLLEEENDNTTVTNFDVKNACPPIIIQKGCQSMYSGPQHLLCLALQKFSKSHILKTFLDWHFADFLCSACIPIGVNIEVNI